MFWERFYNLCLEKGTKPNPVAKALGISSGIVTKWKTLGTLPNGDTLTKLADYLGCSVDYLLGRTEEKEKPTAPEGDELDVDTNTVAKICDIVMRETGKSADKIIIQSMY